MEHPRPAPNRVFSERFKHEVLDDLTLFELLRFSEAYKLFVCILPPKATAADCLVRVFLHGSSPTASATGEGAVSENGASFAYERSVGADDPAWEAFGGFSDDVLEGRVPPALQELVLVREKDALTDRLTKEGFFEAAQELHERRLERVRQLFLGILQSIEIWIRQRSTVAKPYLQAPSNRSLQSYLQDAYAKVQESESRSISDLRALDGLGIALLGAQSYRVLAVAEKAQLSDFHEMLERCRLLASSMERRSYVKSCLPTLSDILRSRVDERYFRRLFLKLAAGERAEDLLRLPYESRTVGAWVALPEDAQIEELERTVARLLEPSGVSPSLGGSPYRTAPHRPEKLGRK